MKTFSKQPAETCLNRISCALCGSSESSKPWKNDSMQFVKCSNCGLVFQNPQPDPSELLNRYDDDYFDYEIGNEDAFFNLMKLGLADIGFFAEEERIIDDYSASGRHPSFLDIGCATGRLIDAMRSRGWDVKGAEVCRQSADYGIRERNLNIHRGTVESAGYPDNSFDVVHCSHLIEHLTAPGVFMNEVARILKPGGLFIVVTPDISGFQARLFKSEWRSAISDHMYLFSKRTLKAMMEKNGFRIVKTASWGGLAAGTAPYLIKRVADKLVKCLGSGDVVCIMGMI